MIRPDTDVRARGPTHARDPRGARPRGLARLLLLSSAKAFAVLLLSATPACVIPVVPGFEDPPEATNYAPQITDPSLRFGTTVTADVFRLSFTLRDPNPTDDLHVRVIVDPSPIGGSTGRVVEFPVPAPADGQIEEIKVSCTIPGLESGIAVHDILVIVADREFVSLDQTTDPFALTKDDGLSNAGSWQFAKECFFP